MLMVMASNTLLSIGESLTWTEATVYLLIIGITWIIYAFGIKPFLSPLRKIPGPAYNPIFGNIRQAMVGEAMEASVGMVTKYGGIVRFYHLLGRERVLVADPKGLLHLMATNEDNYERMAQNLVIGSGIFNVTGDVHKYQRKLINPLFTMESIRGYLGKFQAYGEDLVGFWDERISETEKGQATEVEIHNDILRMLLDVIGDTVLGHKFNHLRNPDCPYSNAIHVLTTRPQIRWVSLLPFGIGDMLPFKENIEYKENVTRVYNFLDGIIEEKRKQLSTPEGQIQANMDLLGKLMLARDEQGQGLTNKELRDQLISFILAGHESTTNAMSWIMLTIAQHPEVQARLRAEVEEKLPPEGDSVGWDIIEGMPYLDAVIKECLRLYPAAPSFVRRAKNDDVLEGYFIPKGTILVYHLGAMMRNPKLWPEPTKFQPERFLDQEANMAAFMPFAAGLHKCMGQKYAMISMKLFIALFLRKFEFDIIPGIKFKRVLRVLLKSSPKIRLRIRRI